MGLDDKCFDGATYAAFRAGMLFAMGTTVFPEVMLDKRSERELEDAWHEWREIWRNKPINQKKFSGTGVVGDES